MEDNYGLRAYELYKELSLRMDKLENDLALRDSVEAVFDDAINVLGKRVVKSYVINAKTACAVKVTVKAKTLTGKCKIGFYVNGVKKGESDFIADTDEYFNEFDLKKGRNVLRLTYDLIGEDYCFFTPVITIEGLIKAVNDPKRVSVTKSAGAFEYNYRFSFVCGDMLEYCSYSGESGVVLIFTVDGVKSAAAVTCGGKDYLLYLTLNGRLKCVIPNGNGYDELAVPEIYGADVAAYSDGDGAKIFLVKFGDLFVADFSGTQNLNFIKSGIKARRVYAENDIKRIITVCDGKPSYLIAATRFPLSGGDYTSVTLPIGDNYHLYEADGGYDIVYSQNGVIKKITLIGGAVSDPLALTVGDEIIKTDSAALVRKGQNLKEAINYKYNL